MKQFIKAVYRKDLSQMRKILDDGFDINTKDSDGRTALMHAILDSEPDVKVIEFLINNGCDINCQDHEQKWTALHFAVRDNKKEAVTTLLHFKPLVNLVDAFGNTPLWRAVMSFNGDISIVSELLKFGADPSKANESGVSPRSLAESMGKIELINLF